MDGDVKPDDVIMLNKYMVSMDCITLTEEGRANADFNLDDTLTSEDALQILRYVVEIIHSFSA